MAEKRRSSPGTTMSLKAHAFSVEALIGAEKQQQQQPPPARQPKRRKLGGEEEAAEDEGASGCCSKSSPPANATVATAGRTCGDMELGCAAVRAPAGELPSPPPLCPRETPFSGWAPASPFSLYSFCLSTFAWASPAFAGSRPRSAPRRRPAARRGAGRLPAAVVGAASRWSNIWRGFGDGDGGKRPSVHLPTGRWGPVGAEGHHTHTHSPVGKIRAPLPGSSVFLSRSPRRRLRGGWFPGVFPTRFPGSFP